MVNKILTNVPYRETKFKNPPAQTYAVYMDSVEVRGSDKFNHIAEHDITIELYEYAPDKVNELIIENNFDLLGIPYTKQERAWIDTEKLYQIIYEFSYVQKKGD